MSTSFGTIIMHSNPRYGYNKSYLMKWSKLKVEVEVPLRCSSGFEEIRISNGFFLCSSAAVATLENVLEHTGNWGGGAGWRTGRQSRSRSLKTRKIKSREVGNL